MIRNIYDINIFASYYRVDGYKEYFGLTNLFHVRNRSFLNYWCKTNYQMTYNNMYQNGLKYKTKSRTISLSMYGSTIGVTRYPLFIKDDEYKILPRPYHTSKPGNKGWKLVQSFWVLDLIKHIEAITFQYFNQIYPDKKKGYHSRWGDIM